MDIEKLIERLKQKDGLWCSVPTGENLIADAATALSTLQAENEKLWAELNDLKSKWDKYQPREHWETLNELCENLHDELEKVKAERDTAQSLLAERIGVMGAEPITTAFGISLDRLRELAQADREGKVPRYTIGDTVYDRRGEPWQVVSAELHSMRTKNEWLYRCGHEGTGDYRALWHFEAFPSREAALRREQNG